LERSDEQEENELNLQFKYIYKMSREETLEGVTHCGLALGRASDTLRGDREVVLRAVTQNGCALQYASVALRDDRELAIIAVSQHGYGIQWVGESLLGDKEVMSAAVTHNGWVLCFASEDLRGDREVVMTAVKQDGYSLAFSSPSLLGDRCFVLAAHLQRVRKRLRWPRLVSQIVRFTRDDTAFARQFEPHAFAQGVDDAFLEGDLEVGPQATPFWNAVINKRKMN
jgi:hypothetical protein